MYKVIEKPNVQTLNTFTNRWDKVEFETTTEAQNYYLKMRRLGQFSAKLKYGKVAHV